jgi:Spy/CpxP family protein refolding chaperone
MGGRCFRIALLLILASSQARAVGVSGDAPEGRSTAAQAPAPPGPEAGQDPIRDRLFPPELILQRQAELGIDEKQRAALTKELAAFQSQIVEVQWKLGSAAEELAHLLDAPRIDEARALAQADKVMALEREVKRSHLGLLIRIRNLLTDAQRAQLAKLRKPGQ